MKPINKYIDHTLLKPTVSRHQIDSLCQEALVHDFAAVCVNGSFVAQAATALKGSVIEVASVVGFPLGAQASTVKLRETEVALADGAKEIDMVLPLGALKSGDTNYVLEEFKMLRNLGNDFILKVILETAYLNREEKITACKLAVDAGADFVKTSTGFGPGGATLQDVSLMFETVNGNAEVKASGGIRDLETLKQYVELGATRIGTSSGVALMNQIVAGQ